MATAFFTDLDGDNDIDILSTLYQKGAPNIANQTAQIYIQDTAITPLIFTNTGCAISSCEVSPLLPAGLGVNIDDNNCVISGTSTMASVSQIYTITATNVTGDNTATVYITVVIPGMIELIVSDIDNEPLSTQRTLSAYE